MKKLSREFIKAISFLLIAFVIVQFVIIPSIYSNTNLLAQTASSLIQKENMYSIAPSKDVSGAFTFNYIFSKPERLKDGVPFDVPIEKFDETKAGGLQDFGSIRDAWGYPVRENAYMKRERVETPTKKTSLNPFKVTKALAYDEDPNNSGVYNCRANTNITGYFKAYFEDVALDTGEGYDDGNFGEGRRIEACQVLQDISELILLNQTNVTPDILFVANAGMPPGALAAATSYMGYYSVGPDNGSLHKHIISRVDPRPAPGDFDALIMTGFNGVSWDIDSTLNSNTYDFYTVIYHEMLHALGFRGLLPASIISTNNLHHHDTFDRFSFQDDSLLSSFINNISGILQVPVGIPAPWFVTNNVVYRGVKNIIGATPDGVRPIYSPTSWQQGSSLSHFDMNRAIGQTYVMHPSIGTNTVRDIHEHEKEVLCHLGYVVGGLNGCSELTPFANDDFVDLNDTNQTCIDPISNDINPGSNINLLSLNSLVPINIQAGDTFQYYYNAGCTGITTTLSNARSILFTTVPDQSPRVFEYTNHNTSRISFPARVTTTPSCESVTDENEYVCNGDFNVASASSEGPFSQINCSSWGVLYEMSVNIPDYVLNTCQYSLTPDIIHANTPNGFASYAYPAPNNTNFPYLRANNATMLDSSVAREIPIMKLKEPLVVGEDYILSFKAAKKSSLQDFPIKFALLVNPMVSPVNGLSSSNDWNTLPPVNQEIFNGNIDSPSQWYTFEQTFTAEDVYEYLVFGAASTGGWVLFDDISIRPANITLPVQNSISGRVYQDINQNGSQQTATEPSLSGIQVGLFQFGNATPIQTVVTQDIPNLGRYEFNNLSNETYYIALMGENLYSQITQPSVSVDPFPVYNRMYTVSVNGGQNFGDRNFGVGVVTQISGCTDAMSPNYNPLATTDDGSCTKADIKVTKSLIDATLSLFDRYITWRVLVKNTGTSNVTNIQVKDLIPGGLIYYTHNTPNPNTYNSSIHMLSIPELSVGEQTYIDITMKVPNSPKVCGPKTNIAVLHSMDQTDSNSTNNQGQASITLPKCKVTAPSQVEAG